LDLVGLILSKALRWNPVLMVCYNSMSLSVLYPNFFLSFADFLFSQGAPLSSPPPFSLSLSLSLSLSQSHIFGLSLHVISVAPCALRISNLYDVPLCGIVMVLHNLISVGSPAPNNLLAFLVLTYIIFYSSYLVFYLLYLFFFSVPFCLNNLISACLIY